MTQEAIILAAGSGTRLKPLTDHAPKCLTEVNGIPILVNTLHNLAACGITSTTIITGYLSNVISDFIGYRFNNIDISYIKNPHYAITNDMYSLWLARHVLERGGLVLEGDIFFRAKTLQSALESMKNRSFYITGKYNGKKGEILISTDHEKRIVSIHVLDRDESGRLAPYNFMSTGLLCVEASYGKRLSLWLTDAVSKNNVNILFDRVLSNHVADIPLWVYEIGQDEWVEIDTMDDLERAETIFI